MLASQLVRPLTGPKKRWDFDNQVGVGVSGASVDGSGLITIDDNNWGYKGGARVFRITGRGQVAVRLSGLIQTADYDRLIVRYRRPGAPGSATMQVSWGNPAAGQSLDAVETNTDLLRRSGDGWVVEQLRFASEPSLAQAAVLHSVVLKINHSMEAAPTIDLDFVVLTR